MSTGGGQICSHVKKCRSLHAMSCLYNTISEKCCPFCKSKGVPLHAMEELGEEKRYSTYTLLTSEPEGGEGPASRPGRALPPGKGPPVPRAGLEAEARGIILCTRQGSNLGRPALRRHYTDRYTTAHIFYPYTN
jgi:hypothetical protein